MNTFTDRWRQLDWDDIGLRINSKTPADVERALNARQPTREDMMALLSPAASRYLEPMAQRAKRLTRQRFGNTVSFYVPLYLSNLCANDCTYCGFSMSNHIKRKTLDENEIARECAAIRAMGFEHLLLVTGEHQTKVGMDYFRRHIPAIRRQFASLQMEVQPLSEAQYGELKTLGLDGVLVYQETYHEAVYARHHLKGKKQDFFWRLETPDRLGRAGIDKIGLGALTGLSDNWRVDNFMVAEHLLWLQQHYWQSRYSISFPRLRPCAGGSRRRRSWMNASWCRPFARFVCWHRKWSYRYRPGNPPHFAIALFRWPLITSVLFQKPSQAAMPMITPSWSSLRRTITVARKRLPGRLANKDCSQCGKTGIAGWDAPRSRVEKSCKPMKCLRSVT